MWTHQQEWIDSNPGVIQEYEALRAAAITRAGEALTTATDSDGQRHGHYSIDAREPTYRCERPP